MNLELMRAIDKLSRYISYLQTSSGRKLDNPPENPINLTFIVENFTRINNLLRSQGIAETKFYIDHISPKIGEIINADPNLRLSLKQEMLQLPIQDRLLPIFIVNDMLKFNMENPLLDLGAIIASDDFTEQLAINFAKEIVVGFRNFPLKVIMYGNSPPIIEHMLETQIKYAILCKKNNKLMAYEYIICNVIEYINNNTKHILDVFNIYRCDMFRCLPEDPETNERISKALFDACLRKDLDTIQLFLKLQELIITKESKEKFLLCSQPLDDVLAIKFVQIHHEIMGEQQSAYFSQEASQIIILLRSQSEEDKATIETILNDIKIVADNMRQILLSKIDNNNLYKLHVVYKFLKKYSDSQQDREKYELASLGINYFVSNPKELLFIPGGMPWCQENILNPQEITYNLEGLPEGAGDKEDKYIEQFTSYCLANPNCLNDFLQQTNSLQAREEYKAQLSKLKYIIKIKDNDFKFIGSQSENKISELLDRGFSVFIKHPVIVKNHLEDINRLRTWFQNSLEPKDIDTNELIKPGDISSATFLAEFVKYVESNIKELKAKQDRDVRAEAAAKRMLKPGA